jgi:hybrid cluster-associated redox disulfide protein
MEHLALSPDALVADLLARFPELASLFVEMRLGCVGCSMSRFCTLEEVSIQYELEIEAFLAEAQARISLHEIRANLHR